ncbi:MAG TPA: DUF6659 family protein [Nitrososphaeraceae archaeon]|nr:DUF6659 family protein [Nitrososphaeraceae archaeon]
MANMKSDQFSQNILNLDPAIRFAGIVEKSGHLYAGNFKEGIKEHLKGRNPELSLAQSAYIIDLRKIFISQLGKLDYVIYAYDKVKMITVPVKEHVLVFSSDHAANSDDLLQKVTKYIRSVEEDLSLYPPSNVIDDKKREIVRNLHLSGISEDMIADQLDIDINTVRMVIQEISTL